MTIVKRDKLLSSVGATHKESTLYPRCENTPTIRDKAPGAFSINTEIILLIMCAPFYLIAYHPLHQILFAWGRRARFGLFLCP